MPRANEAVSDLLLEFADLLSILSGDPFKPRAYEKAAQAVSGYAADVSGLDLKGILAIPSVGKSIGEKVHEYLTTGAIAELDELRAKVPAGVRDMMRIPGLGPKKAMSLYTEVGVGSIDENTSDGGRPICSSMIRWTSSIDMPGTRSCRLASSSQ